MTTRFYNDQSCIIDSGYLPLLQKKFGLSIDEINRRKEWIDMGYFKRTYSVLFSEVAHTKESMFHINTLLNKFVDYNYMSIRFVTSRVEFLEIAQKAVESCLMSCKSGFYVRDVNELAFSKLQQHVLEMLKQFDVI